MQNTVFNGNIGSSNIFEFPQLNHYEEKELLAQIFEQILLFDKIVIRTDRPNFPLLFLIKHLGIDLVEELLERKYINFLLWTPVIVSGTGKRLDDGTIDESTVKGEPPIANGQLSDEDIDPENNIAKALNHFDLRRDRRRSFTRKAIKNYIIPNGMEFSSESTKFIINAYKANNLKELGLPYEVEPEQLSVSQRSLLLNLGSKVLETSILSKFTLKSYENYEHYKICESNLKNIGRAYNVSNNTSTLLELEDLPNLKALFIASNLDFASALRIRNLSSAKYFRKWINNTDKSSNSKEVTKEYLKEIKGTTKYFNSDNGKFIRTAMMFGIGSALGTAVVGTAGIVAGFALSALDTFWLDSILKGNNPSMFIDKLKIEVEEKKQGNPIY